MAEHLIPVFTGNLQQETPLCNARDLHAALKVGRIFATWITGRIAEYGFVEGEDYFPVSGSIRRGRGQPKTDYHLTLDMAKELAMVENNEIGRQVRRYFIRAEAELRARIEAEWRVKASHVLPLPGVKKRARDGLRLKETLILRQQSDETMAQLLAATHPAQRQNLWYLLKQVNDAVGIPTSTLAEIDAAPVLPSKRGG